MKIIRLQGRETHELREALLVAFNTEKRMAELLLALNKSYNELTAASLPYSENVQLVIENAAQEGWLVDLVAKAHENVPADEVLRRFHEDFAPIVPPAGIDHFKVCRLTGSYVMVDRDPLRKSLQGLHEPHGKRILVVTGPSKRGKSHSVQLISYLYAVKSGFWFVPIDLGAYKRVLGPDKLVDPWDLATRLVRMLRYDQDYDLKVSDPPDNAQWANWVLEFCDLFEPVASLDHRRPWVVIDGFNSVPVMQATHDLIKELAYRITVNLTRFRLILLGYAESFPAGILPMVDKEVIGDIREKQVLEFFKEAFTQLEVASDGPSLVQTTVRVLDGLDPASDNYLIELGARASNELEKAAPRKVTHE